MSADSPGFYPRIHQLVVEIVLVILLLLGAFKVVQVVWRETVADAPSPQERVVQRP